MNYDGLDGHGVHCYCFDPATLIGVYLLVPPLVPFPLRCYTTRHSVVGGGGLWHGIPVLHG